VATRLKNQTNHSNPKLYGLAFDCQQVTKIESQSWDVALELLGDYLVLRKYARARRLDNELMAKTMSGLNWI
jgi:hypothetical protein